MGARNILRLINEAFTQTTDSLNLSGNSIDTPTIATSTLTGVTTVSGSTKYTVAAKTASYAVTASDFGSILTTRGAGSAVTFTLPAASGNGGHWVEFYNVADQNMFVAGTAGELVFFNDLAGNSISFETSSKKIGGGFRAVCDGTSWIVVPLATETQTISIAT